MAYFVGLDVLLEETAICVVDDAGTILREGKAESEPEATSVNVAIERVGLEAGPLSPWLCTELQAAGLPAVCLETRRMKGAIAAMAVKTDRNDARANRPGNTRRLVHRGACQDNREPGAAPFADQSQDAAH